MMMNKLVKKTGKIMSLFFIIIIILSIVFFVRQKDMVSPFEEEYRSIGMSGEYSKDGGNTYKDFNSLVEIETRDCYNLVIRANFLQEIPAKKNIFVFLENMDLEMGINGERIYLSSSTLSYYWDVIESPGISPEDEVTFTMKMKKPVTFNYSFGRFFDRICTGTKFALLSNIITEKIALIIIALAIITAGISMIFYPYFIEDNGDNRNENTDVIFCGMTLIGGGLICLMDFDYITLIFERLLILEYISHMLHGIMAVSLMIYLQKYVHNSKFKRIGNILIIINMMFLMALAGIWIADYSAIRNFYILCVFIRLVVLFIFLYMVLKDIQPKRMKNSVGLLSVSLLVLLTGMIMEIVFFVYTGSYFNVFLLVGLVFFAAGQYYIIVREGKYVRKELIMAGEYKKELAESRINLLMSQIQPHFLFNALGTIKALCNRNPEEARTAIDYFARYIRANMDAFREAKCISFKKEMEIVDSYFYIEKLRFKDKVSMEKNIKEENFYIPAMTIQTLVENALKHGLLPQKDGGTVTVSAEKTNNNYVVTVEDDGVGFDTESRLKEKEGHIGIDNSIKRVSMMCGGTLEITSNKNAGTCVKIILPADRNGII